MTRLCLEAWEMALEKENERIIFLISVIHNKTRIKSIESSGSCGATDILQPHSFSLKILYIKNVKYLRTIIWQGTKLSKTQSLLIVRSFGIVKLCTNFVCNRWTKFGFKDEYHKRLHTTNSSNSALNLKNSCY